MSIQASPQENPGYLYGVKRTPASTAPIQVPVGKCRRVNTPAPETPAIRFPSNLTEALNFAYNPGAWR